MHTRVPANLKPPYSAFTGQDTRGCSVGCSEGLTPGRSYHARPSGAKPLTLGTGQPQRGTDGWPSGLTASPLRLQMLIWNGTWTDDVWS